MDKTKIETFDSTWNPVTGCYHTCEYCYARSIANRFGCFKTIDGNNIKVLDTGSTLNCVEVKDRAGNPYPEKFTPTLHRYRLNEYEKKKGRNIFVCSMADLFGSWVPLSWQQEVFEACRKAPQHNYMFLTKNPEKYMELQTSGVLPEENNMWYGTTVTTPDDPFPYYFSDSNESHKKVHLFLSIEPILADFGKGGEGVLNDIDWVIIGAETGNRKNKVVPEKSWIDNLVAQCREYNIPVFMKESLRALYGENLLREFPKGLLHG